jgi:hypothetical protein
MVPAQIIVSLETMMRKSLGAQIGWQVLFHKRPHFLTEGAFFGGPGQIHRFSPNADILTPVRTYVSRILEAGISLTQIPCSGN